MPSKTLTIDAEFKSLIPPLTTEERAELEASLKAEGCRDALVVWAGQGVLLDGHNRYELCQRHGIAFQVVERAFESRDYAIVWIVKNQLARRNLSQYARDEMVTQHMKPALARMGRAKMSAAASKDVRAASAESAEPLPVHNTDKEMAQESGTSERGIRQSSYIASNAPENLKEKARTGEVSRNRAYELTRLLEKLPEADRARAVELCGESEDKAKKLVDLHKSIGSPGSNGTYDEIIRTGGFHYGRDLDLWTDFKTTSYAAIVKALKTLSDHHRRMAAQQRQAELEAVGQVVEDTERYVFHTASARDLLSVLEANSVDFIITDPPYPRDFLPTYGHLAELAAHVLKPGGSVLTMVGKSYLPEVMALMTPHLSYHWTLSYQTPGGQAAQIWDRMVNTFWKPVLWFVKGEYTRHWIGDVVTSTTNDNDKRFHKWGQSLSGMRDLMRRFVLPGDVVLDPFVGGGTTAVIALELGCRFIGGDIDASKVNLSKGRIMEVLGEQLRAA